MKLFRPVAVVLLMLIGSAWAQTYPDKSRPIKIIVPSGTGSSGDLQSRALARAMGEVAGLNVIVENKTGADGAIGMQAAKTAPADGYTVLLGGTSTMVLNAHMVPNLPYDPVRDFTPLIGLSKFTLVLNAGSSLPFKTFGEFVEAARANPGKYTYASASSTTRMAMEMVEREAGIKLLSVPYKAMIEATTALASGQVDLLMNDVATVVPFYQSGRLRPLAVTGQSRMTALPNVPTLREQGLANYELSGWWAYYFPTNTPPAVVATMRDIIRKAAQTKYVTDAIALASFEPLDIAGDAQAAMLRDDLEKWGKRIRASGGAAR